MKKIALVTMVFMLFSIVLPAQSYLPLTDNMDIPSNSNVKIAFNTYSIQDTGNDGLIRIDSKQNIVIDGDSVQVDGVNYTGCMVKITNSSHIVIRNFTSVSRFNYAVEVLNSDHIVINANKFAENKVDSSGWIDVWADYTQALGGGIMFYNCDSVQVYGNIMNLQNDGVALYHSKHADIHENEFSWNTSYGIRMFYTDSSWIHNNNAAHVNRPLTDPSDCAALLMIVSNANTVEYNDLRYSGDGVFLGQYQHSNLPNNNYFYANNCSGSPHNAIEATFADGNVYVQNICNNSSYGLWLGYSFNTLVLGNDIEDNQVAGIAIDRGFNNQISNNVITQNPAGIQLWRGSPATGYTNQLSHDYLIDSNMVNWNTIALSVSCTDNMHVSGNEFIMNYKAVSFDSVSSLARLRQNYFGESTTFDIYSKMPQDVDADSNIFALNDTAYISGKIYDHLDNPASGTVSWQHYLGQHSPVYTTIPPSELSEPPAVWIDYPEACWWLGLPVPINVSYDSINKIMGAASVHLNTGTGWYNDLSYRAGGDTIPNWDLTNYGYLSFWIKSVNPNVGAFQYFHVRIGNTTGGYFRYNSTGGVLNQSLGVWKHYIVPLYGSPSWPMTATGNVSLSNINYVEIYTDSYGVGYDLWLDGVQFLLANGVIKSGLYRFDFQISPNPAIDSFSLDCAYPGHHIVRLYISDLQGKEVLSVQSFTMNDEIHKVIDLSNLQAGTYFIHIASEGTNFTKKLVKIR